MTRRQANNLLGILLVILCIAGIVWGVIRKKNRRQVHEITAAKVYNYTIGGRGNAGGIWVDFIFVANNREYKGSSLKSTDDIDASYLNKYMLNRTFPTAYDPNDPSNSELLVTPKDFREFGYSFPDSLKWVLQHLVKK